MFTWDQIEGFKEMAPFLIKQFPSGVAFILAIGDTVEWSMATRQLDVPAFKVGARLSADGAAARAMLEKQEVIVKLPRGVYGPRMLISSVPVVRDGEIVGALSIGLPRLNPLAAAFNDFAPRITEFLPEGGVIYITDHEGVAYKQGAKKFDLDDLNPGTKLKPDAIARQCMQQKSPISREMDEGVYGVPVLVSVDPLFDEDDPGMVVGSFGLCLPKENARKMRTVVDNLNRNLTEIAAVLEQLAASATEINLSEQELNANVEQVNQLTQQIGEVMNFTREIADQTKMLGLNAAIEAARAGEAGRGFGVVAEEIRRLSDQSRETVVTIKDLVGNIFDKMSATQRVSASTLKSSEEQAAGTQEITASVEELTSMAEELNRMAANM